jgi:protein-S-isoprenylcysteine O-methyltransferase Ste14
MRSLELRIPPLVVVIVFGAAMAALAWVVPAPVPLPARNAVAALLAAAGVSVALAGVAAFRRQRTTVNPLTPGQASALVASGIYRCTRNPMYLGFLLVLLGWWACLANWASTLLLPAFVVYMNRFQIEPEERALAQRFPEQFAAYSKSVRRWV